MDSQEYSSKAGPDWPVHIIKTEETVIMSEPIPYRLSGLRKATIAVLAILILGSWFFGENLFLELSFGAQALLLGIVIKIFLPNRKTVYIPSEVELQFYKDYLLIYRPKRYYDKRVTRCEYNKMYYAEMHSCEYRTQMQVLYFRGSVEAKWYNYTRDGIVPELPTFDKRVERTMQYISRKERPGTEDLIREIEKFLPMKIEIVQNM